MLFINWRCHCVQGADSEEVRQAIRPYCLEVLTVLTAGGMRFGWRVSGLSCSVSELGPVMDSCETSRAVEVTEFYEHIKHQYAVLSEDL